MSRNVDGRHFVEYITRTIFDPQKDLPRVQIHKCPKCKGNGCSNCYGTGKIRYRERPGY